MSMTQSFSRKILNTLSGSLMRENVIAEVFADNGTGFQWVSSSKKETEISSGLSGDFTIPYEIKPQCSEAKINFLDLDENTQTVSEIVEFAEHYGLRQLACVPISNPSGIVAFVLIGSALEASLTTDALAPFLESIELASIALTSNEQTVLEQSLPEEATSSSSPSLPFFSGGKIDFENITSVFATIHEKIRRSIGDYSFFVALYDEKTHSIRIPYLYEEGRQGSIDTFPLGEGLTSILIRSKQPLMLNQDTEQQAESLGAKNIGRPAKSWMGVPLINEGRVLGGLALQDLDQENVFSQADLDTFSSLAQQFAEIIQIAITLDENRRHLSQVLTAADIARDISSALNLDELLLKAVDLIRERFNFYHVAIFLTDNTGSQAVIREATGEAGIQMKRSGFNLAVGSKSIVGYVTSQGEPLIVNDTDKDALHLPNLMLPDTHAEAAIPLMIGDRILGALDVQSVVQYAFGSQEISSLQILADQLAIAVNNSELFAEIQEHLSQHRLLHHITTSAASGTTLNEALISTVQGLQVTMGGDRVVIFLVDEERKNLVTQAYVGYTPETANTVIPIGTGITGWVAAHRKPLRVNDVSQDARYIELSPNSKSELALPLVFRNDLLGVLNVESEQLAAYTENDEEMLGTLAGSIAAIVANAKLVEQIRKQVDRERQLHEITSKIRRSTNVQSILLTTINELNRVTAAQYTQVKVGIGTSNADAPTKGNGSNEP